MGGRGVDNLGVKQSPEEHRLRALARYDLFDQDNQVLTRVPGDTPETDTAADITEDVAALTRLAVVVTGLPLAALNIFDATHQIQLSTVGSPAGVSPREESPCAGHFLDGELVHAPDASTDPRFADNAYVDGRLAAMRAYASAPLVTDDGHPLGTLCVADVRPKALTEQQLDALADLSRVVVSLFERRRQAHLNARLAAEADEQRELAELLIAEAGHRTRLVEAVFDSVGVGIIVADADGHLMTTNATADTWLARPVDGRLPLAEHARAYDLRTADGTRPMTTEMLPLHRALREGPVDQIEMIIAAPDGTQRPVVCSARPLHDEDGMLTGAVAALHDITALRAREAALQTAHEQVSRHAEQAAAVARAAQSVTTADDPRQAICDAVRDLTDAQAAFLLQPDGDRLVATATSGLHDGPTLTVALTEGVDGMLFEQQSLAATAYASGEFLFVSDVAADPRHDTEVRTTCDIVSGAWQPITLRGGRSIGVLAVVWHDRVVDLSTTTQAMLGTLAGGAATAIERASLLEQLARAADQDPLTGLANRRSWDRDAGREIARATREGTPLSFLMADLDHFKAYNDTRGHLAGDELLRAFAVAASDCLREVDVLARWGGEEFVMALPGCSGTDAVTIADRIRECVPSGQTATVGVVEWTPGATSTQVLAQADAALYRGKRGGRDQTVLHTPDGLPAPIALRS